VKKPGQGEKHMQRQFVTDVLRIQQNKDGILDSFLEYFCCCTAGKPIVLNTQLKFNTALSISEVIHL
jgi:hypothetical protein